MRVSLAAVESVLHWHVKTSTSFGSIIETLALPIVYSCAAGFQRAAHKACSPFYRCASRGGRIQSSLGGRVCCELCGLRGTAVDARNLQQSRTCCILLLVRPVRSGRLWPRHRRATTLFLCIPFPSVFGAARHRCHSLTLRKSPVSFNSMSMKMMWCKGLRSLHARISSRHDTRQWQDEMASRTEMWYTNHLVLENRTEAARVNE